MEVMEKPSAGEIDQDVRPSITFLNHSGDVTISWDDVNREQVEALVAKKMAEGFSFFVVRPAGIKGRPSKLKKASEMALIETKALKVGNKVNGHALEDDDLIKALTDHVISIERKPETIPKKSASTTEPRNFLNERNPQFLERNTEPKSIPTTRRATKASEVLDAQTVAIKPLRGG